MRIVIQLHSPRFWMIHVHSIMSASRSSGWPNVGTHKNDDDLFIRIIHDLNWRLDDKILSARLLRLRESTV